MKYLLLSVMLFVMVRCKNSGSNRAIDSLGISIDYNGVALHFLRLQTERKILRRKRRDKSNHLPFSLIGKERLYKICRYGQH
jgi:hypothetical protein